MLDVDRQPCDRRGGARKIGAKEISLEGQKNNQNPSVGTSSVCTAPTTVKDHNSHRSSPFVKMSAEDATTNGTELGGRTAIGISFGNSNSSIAYTTVEDKAEVIANEDGGS